MAIGNVKLTHDCFPKHMRMGSARIKLEKDTKEIGKNRRVTTWKEVQPARQKDVPTPYLKLRPTVPPGSLLSEAVDELN